MLAIEETQRLPAVRQKRRPGVFGSVHLRQGELPERFTRHIITIDTPVCGKNDVLSIVRESQVRTEGKRWFDYTLRLIRI
jgi:hypothetical protein